MLPSLAATLPLLIKYGYALLFLGAVIEGPIITILGAFLASQGSFNIFFVFLAVVIGDLAGDALYYAIGYFSSRFPKLLKFLGLTDERLKPVEDYYKEHGAKAMFFAKFTPDWFLSASCCRHHPHADRKIHVVQHARYASKITRTLRDWLLLRVCILADQCWARKDNARNRRACACISILHIPHSHREAERQEIILSK